MTNLEGRVIRRRRALPPPDGVLDDLQMMKRLADRLGRGQYFSDDPREVFDELRRASAGGIADYAGISYERIEAEQGVFWPCPERGPPGHAAAVRRRLPDRRTAGPRSIRVEHRAPAETPDADYPYVLTTGRLMAQYQSGTQTRRVPSPPSPGASPRPSCIPIWPGGWAIAAADIVELDHPRGARRPSGPRSATTSGPTRSSCRSTGAAPRPPTP